MSFNYAILPVAHSIGISGIGDYVGVAWFYMRTHIFGSVGETQMENKWESDKCKWQLMYDWGVFGLLEAPGF